MAGVLDSVWTLGRKWQAWVAVSVICVGLEAGAVYFQLTQMQFPCELCIYSRVWLAAIALVAIAGLLLRNTLWPLRVVIAAELLFSMGLASVVWQLLGLEYGFGGAGACSMFPNFPSWAPLDQWLPVLFQVQGPCAATPQVIAGLSMADGLAGVAVGFIVAFALALVGTFLRVRR
jgi:disulfide bond formation protein DsbB